MCLTMWSNVMCIRVIANKSTTTEHYALYVMLYVQPVNLAE